MAVRFHPHAQQRLNERGTTRREVQITVERGEQFSAKFGRVGFRRNFNFNRQWQGKYYRTKQVEAFAVPDGDDWLVITVITRYF